MNTNSLQQQKVWATLPGELRTLLSAEETVEFVENTGMKYGLSQMEQGFLLRITGKLLDGRLPPTEFVKEIENNIDITRDKAMYIAQDLNRDLFNGVKDALKKLHGVGGKSGAPTGTVPAPEPVRKEAGTLIRSDWNWHGKKNEVTGQIEFKRESPQPGTLSKNTPTHSPASALGALGGQANLAGTAHIGSIFEQKLGGAFRMKGAETEYSGTPTPPPTLHPVVSPSSTTGLRVPHKPTEIKIPPIQTTEPPK